VRILLATDAWFPQTNGVVRTLHAVTGELERMGHCVRVVSPADFRTIPCPTYPEIRLALAPGRKLRRILDEHASEAIHIATEGPLGQAMRALCRRSNLPFTTSFHTRFPDYLHARFHIPHGITFAALRRFHAPAAGVMVAAPTLRRELESRGFTNVRTWSRGVDTMLFRPGSKADLGPRPALLYVGRVAVEKNIEAFLETEAPGTKVVVGDGPLLPALKRKYPAARFVGALHGESLAEAYRSADVFVFPSRTDTFGLVMLEALASGLPVAAYPVPGPLDVVGGTEVGVLDEDLARAIPRALTISPELCRAHALAHSWEACARQFLGHLAPFGSTLARSIPSDSPLVEARTP
jgi:glycosyltransferase involved in cell wall biosynthesis